MGASGGVGLACAVFAAIFNGSWASLFKSKKMAALSIHPMVFQLYVSIGIFLTSLLVIPFLRYNPSLVGDEAVGDSFQFSGLAVLGGFLLVLAVAGCCYAVDDIGVALAQGIWGGGAMLVSYFWGAFMFGEVPSKPFSSALGLVLLVVGVVFIAFCGEISKKLRGGDNDELPLLASASANGEENGESEHAAARNSATYTRGVLWAISVALSGGSVLVPLHYVPPAQQGLVFLPSFGFGALLTAPTIFFGYTICTGHIPLLHFRKAFSTGVVAGLVWNIGNLLSIIAIPSIGYGVAYPIYQAAIVVSGLWGIYFFHEIEKQDTIRVFWLGGVIVILGAVALSLSQ